ncbi:MAG: hypothetical protein NTX53_01280 [candidate division WOR-3 bacterium]|nr:hypothetical protein [candidate division WOR-3 bacterium]
MEPSSLNTLRRFADTDRATVVDARASGGEVIKIPMRPKLLPIVVLSAVADNLSWFLEQVTGRGYQKAEEVYDVGFTVREPGHQAYGLKVNAEASLVIIARVALLEDETIFQRYVNYLRTGVYL